jgi:hypothetical protein
MSVLPKHDYRSAIDKLTDVTGEIRAFAQQHDTDGQAVANGLASLLSQTAQISTDEIDRVLDELQQLREKVQSDGERVRHQLAEYATLAQSTLQTTRVIADSLRHRFPKRA